MRALKDGCPDYNKSTGNPLTTTRRYFLGKAAKGVGAVALGSLLNERLFAQDKPANSISV